MDFRTRINAVFHGQRPDQIPFAPYDNLIPRGDFERALRNRGAGLVLRRATIWQETQHVSVETKAEGDLETRIYHTPLGDLTMRNRLHVGRLKDDDLDLDIEGMIKGIDDYEAAIYWLDDTQLHLGEATYFDAYRDVGTDGIIRDAALFAPYGATRYLYGGVSGLPRWSQDQYDHPAEFERLVQAVIRREERRLQLILDSPAEFLSLGDLDGTWGPARIRQYDLPLYRKWVPILKAKGKICSIHAHAVNLSRFKDLVADFGCQVVEAFTPPPVGDLSLTEARTAWGKDTIIWINFPETIFWSGIEATRQYVKDLIQSDPPGDKLIFGFTEMGTWGAVTPETERAFREGTLAIMDAIEMYGCLS